MKISGADPYHVGEAAYETIIGIQNEGVQAWYVYPCIFYSHTDQRDQCKTLHQQVGLHSGEDS